jgi:hypothetical protein
VDQKLVLLGGHIVLIPGPAGRHEQRR